MFDILISATVVFLLDQWAKRIIVRHAVDRCVNWGPAPRIRCITAHRGIYTGSGARAGFVLVWLAALASVLILRKTGVLFQSQVSVCGFGLALGGAAGNLCDILRRGGVVDFIDLGWWPVFNLADVAIIGGLLTALWTGS
jgi:signal peptidase II